MAEVGIQSHSLSYVSLFALPLDHSIFPKCEFVNLASGWSSYLSNEDIDASGHDELVKLQIVGIDFSDVGTCDVADGDVWACDDLVGDVGTCDDVFYDVFGDIWACDDFVDDVRTFDDVWTCNLVVDVAINGSDGCAALIDHRVALINWEK